MDYQLSLAAYENMVLWNSSLQSSGSGYQQSYAQSTDKNWRVTNGKSLQDGIWGHHNSEQMSRKTWTFESVCRLSDGRYVNRSKV